MVHRKGDSEHRGVGGLAQRGFLTAAGIVTIVMIGYLTFAGRRVFAWQDGSTGQHAVASDTQLVPVTPQVKGLGHYGEWWRIPDDNARLTFREDEYLRWPLPPGEEKYANVKGEDVKKMELEVVAISEKSKADGNQLWGRIAGTKYDHMTADWVKAHFQKDGLEVHQVQQDMPPQWMPTHWAASVEWGGHSIPVPSAMPIPNSVGTTKGPVDADIIYLDQGYPGDFIGRDVRGKAVLMYSIPTPGGEDSVRIWGGGPERAAKAGAALVIEVQGFPGSATNFHGTPGTNTPSIVISYNDGLAIQQALEAGKHPKFKLDLHVEEQTGLHTETTWGILPGMTDEKIIFLAHHDAYFDGAMDNASGMAMLQYIAAHYAAMPKSQRRRTLVFMDTPLHHTFVIKEPLTNVGARWLRDNVDKMFPNVVLAINCEHITETQFDFLGAGVMSTNTTVGHPFYVNGSTEFKSMVMTALREFGVAVYRVREPSPGGELGQTQFYRTFPSFHIIDREFYHTTLDTPDWTPAAGMESSTRAYLKILDTVNGWDRAKIWGDFKPTATSSNAF
jgi:hypothetical protein